MGFAAIRQDHNIVAGVLAHVRDLRPVLLHDRRIAYSANAADVRVDEGCVRVLTMTGAQSPSVRLRLQRRVTFDDHRSFPTRENAVPIVDHIRPMTLLPQRKFEVDGVRMRRNGDERSQSREKRGKQKPFQDVLA